MIASFAYLGIRKMLFIFSAEVVLLAVKDARLHLHCQNSIMQRSLHYLLVS